MKKYGKSLVNAVPDESTKLLKVLCTDYKPQRLHEREFCSSISILCGQLKIKGITSANWNRDYRLKGSVRNN